MRERFLEFRDFLEVFRAFPEVFRVFPEVFRDFLEVSEVLSDFLSEALSPVAPNRVAP